MVLRGTFFIHSDCPREKSCVSIVLEDVSGFNNFLDEKKASEVHPVSNEHGDPTDEEDGGSEACEEEKHEKSVVLAHEALSDIVAALSIEREVLRDRRLSRQSLEHVQAINEQPTENAAFAMEDKVTTKLTNSSERPVEAVVSLEQAIEKTKSADNFDDFKTEIIHVISWIVKNLQDLKAQRSPPPAPAPPPPPPPPLLTELPPIRPSQTQIRICQPLDASKSECRVKVVVQDKEDLMSQLQNTLQKRKKRESLEQTYKGLMAK